MTLEKNDFDESRGWAGRLVGIVLLAVILGGGAYAGYYYLLRDDSAGATATAPQQSTAAKGRLVTSYATTGTAAATLTTKLTFTTGGQVKSVSVAVGDKVTAGQELARLDDRDAARKLESAKSSLAVAELKLKQLKEPATASDVASARQAVSAAEVQVATAETNLANTLAGPSVIDVIAADSAVLSAENSLASARKSVDTGWTNLLSAQRTYCLNYGIVTVDVCSAEHLPLSDTKIASLNNMIAHPPGTTAQANTIVSATTALLSANTNYGNSKGSVLNAEKALESAQAKRALLDEPPTATTLAQLRSAVSGAEATVGAAKAKLETLLTGPSATDIALQEESVKQVRISLQTQQDAYDGIVLRAPYDGQIGTVPINVGDQVGTATVAMMLTNPEGIRVDLTVTETDIAKLKAGMYGLATFNALSGSYYLVKITGISTTPTIAQGVVTYPVQAQLLRGPDLQANAAAIQQLSGALTSLSSSSRTTSAATTGDGGFVAGGAGGPGAAGGFAGAPGAGAAGQGGAGARGVPGAQGAAGAGGQGAAGAQRTPPANFTPGAGRTALGGGQLLQSLASAPLPSAGMTATITVIVKVDEDVLLVPNGAVKRQGSTTYVEVVKDDGTTEQRTVTTGSSDSTQTIVLTGLTEGEKVRTGTGTTARTTTSTSATPQAAGGRPPTPAGGVR